MGFIQLPVAAADPGGCWPRAGRSAHARPGAGLEEGRAEQVALHGRPRRETLQGSLGSDRDGSRGCHRGDRVWREGKSPFAHVE